MELLALGKPIKKTPRSDERDGDLFCGTFLDSGEYIFVLAQSGRAPYVEKGKFIAGQSKSFAQYNSSAIFINCQNFTSLYFDDTRTTWEGAVGLKSDGTIISLSAGTHNITDVEYVLICDAYTSYYTTFTIRLD